MPYLVGLVAALQILDGLMTRTLVGRGLVLELNPMVSPFAGEPVFVAIKIVGALACAGLLWWASKRVRRLAFSATIVLLVFYAAVLTWNLQTVITSA